MAKYFCAWRDNRGVEHSSEAAALAAEAKYEEERKAKARIEELKYRLRCNIDSNNLPYLGYNYSMYAHWNEFGREESRNKEALIEWLIKNEVGIKAALDG